MTTTVVPSNALESLTRLFETEAEINKSNRDRTMKSQQENAVAEGLIHQLPLTVEALCSTQEGRDQIKSFVTSQQSRYSSWSQASDILKLLGTVVKLIEDHKGEK